MRSLLRGPEFQRPENGLDGLADMIRLQVERHPDCRFTEIDRLAQRRSVAVSALYERALEVLDTLDAELAADEHDLVLCFESLLDFIPAAWASIIGGYTYLPWHAQHAGGQRSEVDGRLRAVAADLRRPVLVTIEGIRYRLLGESNAAFEKVICPGENHSAGNLAPRPAAGSKQGAFLVLTSGTTARPKIALINHQAMFNRVCSYHERVGSRRTIWWLPFDGVTGAAITGRPSADMCYLQPAYFAARPLEVLRAVGDLGIEAMGLSTSHAGMLLDAMASSNEQLDFASLQHVGFGAETIVADVVHRLGMALQSRGARNLKASFGYGMTETGLLCATAEVPVEAVAAHYGTNSGAIVGTAVPGWSVRIVDDDNRRSPPGVSGNIQVRSASKHFSGYLNDGEATRNCHTADGWFITGDVGMIEEGRLTITGRKKAMIIVNARNISLEAIEDGLRCIEGIDRSRVAAGAVRRLGSRTDELAIFFAAEGNDPARLDDVCRQIRRRTAQNVGIAVQHLVPVPAAQFPLTPTGKLMRHKLVELFDNGELNPYAMARIDAHAEGEGAPPDPQLLTDIWCRALKLGEVPSPDENFFDLGGDSLASAQLIFEVEERFGEGFAMEAFFREPTLATLLSLVSRHAPPALEPAGGKPMEKSRNLLRTLQSYFSGWTGERLFPEGLIVGANTAGDRTPIFWICQSHLEFMQLGRNLGPSQPLYGMRSCVGIAPVRNYSYDLLETVGNRYLWELLALAGTEQFVLGGNCQGGIIALALARKLRQLNRPPDRLILMEWGFSFGPYDGPAHFLFGEHNPVANREAGRAGPGPDWRSDFPNHTRAVIRGTHGRFFDEENVASLASAIVPAG